MPSSGAIRVTFDGSGATFHMPGGETRLAPALTPDTPDAESATIMGMVTGLPVLEQWRVVKAAGELLILPFPRVGGCSSSKEALSSWRVPIRL